MLGDNLRAVAVVAVAALLALIPVQVASAVQVKSLCTLGEGDSHELRNR